MARSTTPPDSPAQPARTGLWAGTLCVLGAAGLAALIREYGFRDGGGSVARTTLHLLQWVVAAALVLDWAGRLACVAGRRAGARDRQAFLDATWGEPALAAAALLVGALGRRTEIAGIGPLYVLSMQAYLVVLLLVRAASINLRPLAQRIGPALLMIGGFAAICLAGAGLLMLPVATPEATTAQFHPMFFPDALFTAISAACDAGLVVRDTGKQFTTVGHVIILAMVQLGGLGIMIFGAALMMALGKGLSGWAAPAAGIAGAALRPGERSDWQLGRIARVIVVSSLAIEALGAALLYPMFADLPGADGQPLSAAGALWYSVFHSVTAFCNAGFSLNGRSLLAGVNHAGWSHPLGDRWQVLGVMAPLIVLGGVGFPVLADCGRFFRSLWARLPWHGHLAHASQGRLAPANDRSDARGTLAAASHEDSPALTLHSHVAIWMTGMLIFGGALGLIAVEPPPGPPPPSQSRQPVGGTDGPLGDWQKMPTSQRVQVAVFESASARTAGFSAMDVRELSDAGKLWLCGLMIVGGSPAGTGGGMKTVTVFLLATMLWSFLRRREEVETGGRAIARSLLAKAAAAAMLYLGLVALVTLGLTILMRPGYSFLDLFFEACSACGTVGLSTGVTPSLTEPAKAVVMGGMVAGRLGVLGLLLAMAGRARRAGGGPAPTEDFLIA
jgi:trk system potassium uptake protein TrkH